MKIKTRNFLFILGLFFTVLSASQKIYAQGDTIKFGVFTPPASPTGGPVSPKPGGEGGPTPNPTLQPEQPTLTPTAGLQPTPTSPPANIECAAPPPAELELTLPDYPYSGNKGLATLEIVQAIVGGPLHTEDIYRHQEAAERHLGEFRTLSTNLYGNDAYYYTKGLVRFSLRHGFGLDGKIELEETLSVLTCQERLNKIAKYLPTPLYLYPTEETQVKVELADKSWRVLAYPSGKLFNLADGRWHDSLEHEVAVGDFTPPSNGLIIAGHEVAEKLSWYAKNLGLNEKETADFVKYWQEKLPEANFYFMSHFPPQQAEELLSLEISPAPQTKILAMMYFKPLVNPPKDLSQEPIFEPIPERLGFTAVDFSGVVEW